MIFDKYRIIDIINKENGIFEEIADVEKDKLEKLLKDDFKTFGLIIEREIRKRRNGQCKSKYLIVCYNTPLDVCLKCEGVIFGEHYRMDNHPYLLPEIRECTDSDIRTFEKYIDARKKKARLLDILPTDEIPVVKINGVMNFGDLEELGRLYRYCFFVEVDGESYLYQPNSKDLKPDEEKTNVQ